jgi:hypothetical protein
MSEENTGINISTTTIIIKETIDTNTYIKLTLMFLNEKNYQPWARVAYISQRERQIRVHKRHKVKTNNINRDRGVGATRQCDNVLALALNRIKYKRVLLL